MWVEPEVWAPALEKWVRKQQVLTEIENQQRVLFQKPREEVLPEDRVKDYL